MSLVQLRDVDRRSDGLVGVEVVEAGDHHRSFGRKEEHARVAITVGVVVLRAVDGLTAVTAVTTDDVVLRVQLRAVGADLPLDGVVAYELAEGHDVDVADLVGRSLITPDLLPEVLLLLAVARDQCRLVLLLALVVITAGHATGAEPEHERDDDHDGLEGLFHQLLSLQSVSVSRVLISSGRSASRKSCERYERALVL